MKPKPAPSRGSKPPDNFELLDNIGPKWAERLQNIGITTFEELARCTPPTLAAALNKKADKEIITAEKIEREDWIGQARLKIAKACQPSVPKDIGTVEIVDENSDDQGYHTEHQFRVFLDSCDPAVEGAPWRTRVYHEASGEEKPFPLEPAAWVPWIFEMAHLAEAITPPPLKLLALHVEETPLNGRRGLAVTLQYALHTTGDINEPPCLRVEIFMQDTDTGTLRQELLEDAVSPPPQALGHLQVVFPVPPLGVYWLYALLTLLPPHPASAVSARYAQRIRVVP